MAFNEYHKGRTFLEKTNILFLFFIKKENEYRGTNLQKKLHYESLKKRVKILRRNWGLRKMKTNK